MNKLLLGLLSGLGIVSSVAAVETPPKEGDCWSYASRPGEEASFVVIRKIETLPKVGEVIHVSVFDVKIKSPSAPKGYTDQVGHLPIAGTNARASLKERVDRKFPDINWKEGYGLWREAYDSGRGGVFKTPIRECVDFMEEAINRGKKS